MPQNGSRYLLQFGRQGMVAHQNRWLAGPDELAIAENTCFENDQVQKEPAAPEYDGVGLALYGPTLSLSAASDVTVRMLWFPGSPPVAVVGSVVTAVATTTSPWVVTVTTSAAAGQFLVLAIGQTTNVTTSPEVTSITDSKGNVWTKAGTTTLGSASINSITEVWVSLLTVGLTGGADTLTVTFAAAGSDNRALAVAAYSGVTATTVEAQGGASGDNVTSVISTTPFAGFSGTTYPALLIAATHFNKINTTTPAGTGTTTAGSNAVTGSGLTTFLSDFVPGDELVAGGEVHIVDTVTTNSALTTLEPWAQSLTTVAYTKQSGARVITASLSGNLFKDKPSQGGNTGSLSSITLKSGLVVGHRGHGRFVQAGKESATQVRKLFYFNAANPVQVLSGDAGTTHDLTSPPTDWD